MSQTTSSRMKGNLEILLAEWGAWKRGENRNPLGYPGSSAFQQMRVDGSRKTDPDVLLIDDDLRRVDRYVNGLFPEARLVVTAHYVWSGPVKAKLERVRLSRTGYYDMLDCAHKQLSHWMGGGYAFSQPSQKTILSGRLA